MVLPERPAGTEGLSEEELAALVTRDAMIGVARARRRRDHAAGTSTSRGRPRRPASNGELVFADPWESRAFGAGHGLARRPGCFEWEAFRQQLIAAIADLGRRRTRDEPFSLLPLLAQDALERLLARPG